MCVVFVLVSDSVWFWFCHLWNVIDCVKLNGVAIKFQTSRGSGTKSRTSSGQIHRSKDQSSITNAPRKNQESSQIISWPDIRLYRSSSLHYQWFSIPPPSKFHSSYPPHNGRNGAKPRRQHNLFAGDAVYCKHTRSRKSPETRKRFSLVAPHSKPVGQSRNSGR